MFLQEVLLEGVETLLIVSAHRVVIPDFLVLQINHGETPVHLRKKIDKLYGVN